MMVIIVLGVLRLGVSSITAYNINAMVFTVGEVVVSVVITKHIYKTNGMKFTRVNIKRHNHCGVNDNMKHDASPN